MTHCRAGSRPAQTLGLRVGQASCEVFTQKPPRPAQTLGLRVGQAWACPTAISPAAEWMQAATVGNQGD